MTSEGFGRTAADVGVVSNWFVDLYSNSSKIPQSGHAKTSVEVLGSLFGPRENWPKAVLEGAGPHALRLLDLGRLRACTRRDASGSACRRRRPRRSAASRSSGGANREAQLLTVIGITLHSLQDFYSHSNWIEKQGVAGVDGHRLVEAHRRRARPPGSTCRR